MNFKYQLAHIPFSNGKVRILRNHLNIWEICLNDSKKERKIVKQLFLWCLSVWTLLEFIKCKFSSRKPWRNCRHETTNGKYELLCALCLHSSCPVSVTTYRPKLAILDFFLEVGPRFRLNRTMSAGLVGLVGLVGLGGALVAADQRLLHCRLLFLNQQQYIWCFIQTKILNISLDISLGKTDKKLLEPWCWENMIQSIISNRLSMIISIWGFTPSLHRFPPLLFVPYLSVRLCVARTMVIRRQILLFSLEQNPINPG